MSANPVTPNLDADLALLFGAAPSKAPLPEPYTDVPQPDVNGEFATPSDGAKFMASLGIPQVPLSRLSDTLWSNPGKNPAINGKKWQEKATTDFAQIDAWAKKFPRCNFGSLAKAEDGSFYVLETDSADLNAKYEKETGHTLDAQLVIESSAPDRNHRWYAQSSESLVDLRNIGQEEARGFSLRWDNEQCVSPGSIHQNGKKYRVVHYSPPGPAPQPVDAVLWLKGQKPSASPRTAPASGEKKHIPMGGHHAALLKELGSLISRGYSKQAAETALLLWAQEWLENPGHGAPLQDHVHQMVESTDDWDRGNPGAEFAASKNPDETAADPNKASGTGPTDVEVNEVAAATPTAEPRYPIEVWDGTLFQEYVALCRSNNHLPPEFFIESLKTVIGAICGHRIVPEDNHGEESRSYTTLLSEHAGDGKSETGKWTMNMMRATGLLYDSERPPLDFQNIGAYLDTFASGRGMVEAFFRHPRILQYYDELSIMVEKFGITGSGASFMGLQTDMFESNFPPKSRIGGTRARPADAPPTCHNSVLACTIKVKREAMYANSGAENSGWFPRENLIATGDVELVARLRVPDLTEIGEKLKNKILPLEYRRTLTFYSDAAQQMLDEWFLEMRQRTKDESDDVKGRINVLAQRNASILAWLLSVADQEQTGFYDAEYDPETSYSPIDVRAEITEDIVRRAILLAEYTLAVRRDNQPMVADNAWAKCENIIKKHLCQRTRMTRSTLYREANLSRFGIKIVNASLLNLIEGRLMCIRNKPDVSVTGHTGPMSDEAAVKLPDSVLQWMGDGRTKSDGWKESRGGDRKSPYFHPTEKKS